MPLQWHGHGHGHRVTPCNEGSELLAPLKQTNVYSRLASFCHPQTKDFASDEIEGQTEQVTTRNQGWDGQQQPVRGPSAQPLPP